MRINGALKVRRQTLMHIFICIMKSDKRDAGAFKVSSYSSRLCILSTVMDSSSPPLFVCLSSHDWHDNYTPPCNLEPCLSTRSNQRTVEELFSSACFKKSSSGNYLPIVLTCKAAPPSVDRVISEFSASTHLELLP